MAQEEAPLVIGMILTPFSSQTLLTRQSRRLLLRSHQHVVSYHVRLLQQVPRGKKQHQTTSLLPRRLVQHRDVQDLSNIA